MKWYWGGLEYLMVLFRVEAVCRAKRNGEDAWDDQLKLFWIKLERTIDEYVLGECG